MAEDTVSDYEQLFRSVRGNPDDDEYDYQSGRLIVTPAAFKDRQKNPSVDRAELLGNNPSLAKKNPTDGIVMLLTQKVREIGEVYTKVKEDEQLCHGVDVIPDPTDENKAHALVTVNPDFFGSNNKQTKAFRLLRIALARIATENGWTIEPTYK
jgi:hypothetical protein